MGFTDNAHVGAAGGGVVVEPSVTETLSRESVPTFAIRWNTLIETAPLGMVMGAVKVVQAFAAGISPSHT